MISHEFWGSMNSVEQFLFVWVPRVIVVRWLPMLETSEGITPHVSVS